MRHIQRAVYRRAFTTFRRAAAVANTAGWQTGRKHRITPHRGFWLITPTNRPVPAQRPVVYQFTATPGIRYVDGALTVEFVATGPITKETP
jgi:hypothetical protein